MKRKRHKIGGSVFNRMLDTAIETNTKARMALREIANKKPGPMVLAQLLTQTAFALSENLSALGEIERIAQYSARHIEKLEERIKELEEDK